MKSNWPKGSVPIAVVMLTLNEEHNMKEVLENLKGWANEVFIVDSYSKDLTVDIALANGINIVQKAFTGFGDQWNFALEKLPIYSAWTMKLDPDERISKELKINIEKALLNGNSSGYFLQRRLWFMGKPLPVKQKLLRIWKTGSCSFTKVAVNEHPIVSGEKVLLNGNLEHLDSPDFDHWLEKQNRYTTAEALTAKKSLKLADEPRIFGSSFQRRMWIKKNYMKIPFIYSLFFLYFFVWMGAWKAGRIGYIWARMRTEVMRFIEYKFLEMDLNGKFLEKKYYGPGKADTRVKQY